MSGLALPSKLNKEPLVDALFEIRFSSSVPALSNVIPGLLFSAFSPSAGSPMRIDRLPVAEIPVQIRNADQNLKFQPLIKLHTDRFTIMVGDSSVVLACLLPYPGWNSFKPKIMELVAVLRNTKLIQTIDRYSMKYVDIIDGADITEQIKRINMELKVGTHKLASENFNVTVEIKRDPFIHLVQVAGASVATPLAGKPRTGVLISVDTISLFNTSDWTQFTAELPDRMDDIHLQNKTMFFECLTQETINYLEPIYDTVSTTLSS
jgi:uncharacterized protein (TIGR04255 family)